MKKISTLALVAGAALTCSARAQVDMWLVAENNVNALCDINNTNFWIGSNPSAVALNGSTLYVAGFDNGGDGQTFQNRIIKVGNVLEGTRTFDWLRRANGAAYEVNMPLFRGFTGMAYRPGSGLLVNRDFGGGGGAAGSLSLWDVDSQVNPILVTENTESFFRGAAGPAWDAGFDGTGYPAGYNGAVPASARAAVPVILDFSQPAEVKVGPFALDTANGMSINVGATVYEYLSPADNNLRMDFVGANGTLWRDIAVHPTNGAMAARTNNDLVIGTRPNNNKNFVGQVVVNGAASATAVVQQCEFVATPDGDFVIWNDRPDNSGGWTFEQGVKANRLDGSAVTINWKNADGSAVSFPIGNRAYDFSWDHANQRLAVMDFNSRQYWIFSTQPPAPDCPADFNGDGFLDFFDYDDYVNCFETGVCPPGKTADFNGDGFVDFFDYDDYVGAFETGC
jgi:hypothetical protein